MITTQTKRAIAKVKAQDLIDTGYFHKYMYNYDKHKKLEVCKERKGKRENNTKKE